MYSIRTLKGHMMSYNLRLDCCTWNSVEITKTKGLKVYSTRRICQDLTNIFELKNVIWIPRLPNLFCLNRKRVSDTRLVLLHSTLASSSTWQIWSQGIQVDLRKPMSSTDKRFLWELIMFRYFVKKSYLAVMVLETLDEFPLQSVITERLTMALQS